MAVFPSPEDDPHHPADRRPGTIIELLYEVIIDRRRTVNFMLAVISLGIAVGIIISAALHGVGISAADLRVLTGRGAVFLGGVAVVFFGTVLRKAGKRFRKRLRSGRDDAAVDGTQPRTPAVEECHAEGQPEDTLSRRRRSIPRDGSPPVR